MATRQQILDAISGGSASPVARSAQVLTPQFEPKEPSGDINFLGPLGDIIDIIDTPRAAIASTAQEIVDVFQGEGFSPRDWWQQTSDNHLFGEVLRDSGVDLPGPLDFIAGLGLDIATDPLTYFAGAGVAARLARADDVVRALKVGANAADKAGDAVKAKRMTDAAARVAKSRSVLSAGKALDDIGISSGARLTVPGTGRLSRQIIERPLDVLTGGAARAWTDPRRVRQLSEPLLEAPERFLADNEGLIVNAMRAMRRGDDSIDAILASVPEANRALIQRAASVASRMPVESRIRLPWSTPLVGAVAMAPGRAFRYATQRNIVNSVDEALNYRQPIRKMKMSDDPDVVMAGIYIEKSANLAEIAGRTMDTRLTQDARQILEEAKRLGVDEGDLLRASDRPWGSPEMPPSIVNAGQEFHDSLLGFWNDARLSFNEVVGGEKLAPMVGDLYAARYLSQEGAALLNKGTMMEWTPGAALGNAMERRSYVTPSQYAVYEAQLGREGAAKLYSKTFMGQPLQDVAEKSVRDQMNDIGKMLMGDEYTELFDDSFVTVVRRYIGQMSKQARVGRLLAELEDYGVVVKTDVEGGIRTELADRLSSSVKLQGKTRSARNKAGRAARVANRRRYNATRGGSREQRADANRIGDAIEIYEMEFGEIVHDLVELGKSYARNIRSSEFGEPLRGVTDTNWVNKLMGYAEQANEIGFRLEKLKRLRDGMRASLEAAGRPADPEMFAALDSGIAQIEDALSAFNAGAAAGALDDETVVAAQRLKDTLEGVREVPPSPGAARGTWSADYPEAELVPIEFFDDIKEAGFDRPAGSRAGDGTDLLTEDIRKSGILEPIVVEVNATTGAMTVVNGNHRLAAARRLGHTDVPVTVVKPSEYGMSLPSEVGIPTVTPPPAAAPMSKAMKSVAEWEQIYTEADEIDNALGASIITHEADAAFVERAAARVTAAAAQVIDEIDSGIGAIPAGRTLEEQISIANEQLLVVRDSIGVQQQQLADLQAGLAREAEVAAADVATNVAAWTRQQEFLQRIRDVTASLQLDIADARKAQSGLGRNISAADSQLDAVKMLNDKRNLLGFQEAYNEGLSNQLSGSWFQGYSAVNAGEMGELFQNALQAAAKVNDPREMGEFLTKYGQFVNWWKSQAVMTPGFVLRNGQGGVWINTQLAGVEMGMHSKVAAMAVMANRLGNGDMVAGARILRDAKKSTQLDNVFGVGRRVSAREWSVFHDMADSGIARGGQAWSEVADASAELGQGGTWSPFSVQFRPARGVRHANEKMEFVLRGALAFDALANKGKSIDEAWDLVRKFHFDYTELTNAETRIKLVIPFMKWQKSVLPVLIEAIGKNPKAWGRLQQLKGEMELTSEEEGLVPDYFGESLGIRMPFKFQGSRVYALPDLPFKDLARYLKEPTSPMRTVAEGMIPFVKLPVEIWSGKRVFADIPFSGRYQQVPASYGMIPGLMPILESLGKAKKNKRGEYKMRDRDIYIMDQFTPLFGRLRRLFPNEESKQRRLLSTWISTMTGTGLRTNDPREKLNQWYRLQRQVAKDIEDMADIESREV